MGAQTFIGDSYCQSQVFRGCKNDDSEYSELQQRSNFPCVASTRMRRVAYAIGSVRIARGKFKFEKLARVFKL